ncbi:hypothetical protein P4S65_16460 [Pseudoalteromonas sp. B131b]|uniref:hypothetical protein n=1 Tax=Pseudoalteromonas sp. B131b TaxID=630493 RepID=UPI00301D0D9A
MGKKTHGRAISNAKINQLNKNIVSFFEKTDIKNETVLVETPRHYILTPVHWQSWDDNGYVIIPALVSKKLCEDVCNMLYERLKMDKNNPASWYSCHALKQGVMVQIFNDITMQVIRSLPQVRDVFEQLWGEKT